MSLVELLGHPLARLITLTLLHFLWQGTAIAILLVALVEVWRISSVQRRYICSLATLLLMIVSPVATFGWLAAQHAESTVPTDVVRDQQALRYIAESPNLPGGMLPDSPAWLDTLQPYAFAAWLLGVALLAGRLAAGAVGVWRLRRGSLPLPPELEAVVQGLHRKMEWSSDRASRVPPLVALSRRVSGAVAVGIVRPLVLLPAAWVSEMPPAMLEAVIAHELAHLARRDLLVNLLQRIVETLLFYHPAVWWLSRRLRIEREHCCDELAVAATGRRLEYVQALAHVAQLEARVELQLAASIRGEGNMQLLQRVRNILEMSAVERRVRLWPAGLAALALPVALGLLSLGIGAAIADEERNEDQPRDGEREVRVDKDGERPHGEREGDRPRGEREVERPRREGEREVPREGDRPRGVREVDRPDREGDRPRGDGDNPEAAAVKRARQERARFRGDEEGARRDADRPAKEGPRDGERPAKEGSRDGDRPAKEGARDEDRPVKREIEGGAESRRVAELSAMVKRLMAENGRLREELAAIRKADAVKAEGRRETKEAALEKDAALRQLKERMAAEQKDRAISNLEKAAAAKRAAMERERAEIIERKRAVERERSEAEAVERERERAEAAERKRVAVAEREQAEAGRKSEKPKKDDDK
jgi:beta-lactamase regulating signal transducer with metallopeptidase domain